MISRLQALDGFLIDSVCQPAVDRLPGPPTPPLLAQQIILASGALCSVALAFIWRDGQASWGTGFGLVVVGASILKAFEIGSEASRAAAAPVSRLRDFPVRLMNLVLVTGLVALTPFYREWLLPVSQACMAIGLYVAACRRPPPEEKLSVARRGLKQDAQAVTPG